MTSLSLIVIRAADIEKLASFYSALGLKFERHQHGNGPVHLTADIDNGAILEIYPAREPSEKTNATRLGFRVASVDDTVTALRKINAQILTEPTDSPWGRRAVVKDFEGHKVELYQS